jgi:hypothetical protein
MHCQGGLAAEVLVKMKFKKGRISVPPRTFLPTGFLSVPAKVQGLETALADRCCLTLPSHSGTSGSVRAAHSVFACQSTPTSKVKIRAYELFYFLGYSSFGSHCLGIPNGEDKYIVSLRMVVEV